MLGGGLVLPQPNYIIVKSFASAFCPEPRSKSLYSEVTRDLSFGNNDH